MPNANWEAVRRTSTRLTSILSSPTKEVKVNMSNIKIRIWLFDIFHISFKFLNKNIAEQVPRREYAVDTQLGRNRTCF